MYAALLYFKIGVKILIIHAAHRLNSRIKITFRNNRQDNVVKQKSKGRLRIVDPEICELMCDDKRQCNLNVFNHIVMCVDVMLVL